MRRLVSLVLVSLLVLVLAPAERAQGSVLVVDQLGGPGSHFTSIVEAVAAAMDGDVILVRPGGYQPFVVDGKSLVLAGDAPAGSGPWLLHTGTDHPTVQNLAAEQSVVMRGFRMEAPLGASTEIEIKDCVGLVLLEDVQLSGGGPCLLVQRSDAVVLSRCVLQGQDSLPGGSFGPGDGIEAVSANLYLYECETSGGSGRDASFPTPPDAGRHAVRAEGGSFFASGTVLRGGDGGNGGDGVFFSCFRGGDGGDGLVLGGGASTATTLDCALSGGAGGDGHSHCMPGNGGYPVRAPSDGHVALAGTHGSMTSTSPLREGTGSALELWGAGAALVVLLVAPEPQVFFDLALSGVVVPAVGSSAFLLLGSAHPSGYLSVFLPVGLLPPGVEANGLYLQPAFVEFSTGSVTVGQPSHVLVLDETF